MISENLKKRLVTSILLISLLILMIVSKPIFLYLLIIIGIFSIIEFTGLIKKINKKFLLRLVFNLIFIIFVFILFSLFFILSDNFQFKIVLFTLLLTCISSDLGGYIFGKIFKGPKISKISPNKTISGSIGSFIFSSLTFCGLFFLMTKNISYIIILTGVITSLVCQIGDLFFSYLKRRANKKDTGNLLPGHGGVLDRIDGIIFGLPAGFIFLIALLR
tara:strand:+ start:36 stop:689 length:654 start_codon:yes stop_codon:yes gene_type:complete